MKGTFLPVAVLPEQPSCSGAFFHKVKTTGREDSLHGLLTFVPIISHCSVCLSCCCLWFWLYLCQYCLPKEWAQHVRLANLLFVQCSFGFVLCWLWFETAIISWIFTYIFQVNTFFIAADTCNFQLHINLTC